MAEEVRAPADPMHLYYFHKGGKGLYRYGQLGHNQTNSFDWRLDGDKLELLFRKTGERARTTFLIRHEEGRRTLELRSDPRAATPTRYRFAPATLAELGPLAMPAQVIEAGQAGEGVAGGVVDHMWIDLTKFATGGMGFSMYQLSRHPAQPGWQIGWYHRGDFDDWTTERMTYRVEGPSLRTHFSLRGDEHVTPFVLAEDPRQRGTALTLASDARNFFARSRFLDAGPSF
jgi:hypothetical protein